MGHDERDRQLPGPSVALALHDVVPGRADEFFEQRGPRSLAHHDGVEPVARLLAVPPRSAVHSSLEPRLSTDLEAALPGARPDTRDVLGNLRLGVAQLAAKPTIGWLRR